MAGCNVWRSVPPSVTNERAPRVSPQLLKRRDKRLRHLAILVDVGASVCLRGKGAGGGMCVCVCNMRKACCAVHIGDI